MANNFITPLLIAQRALATLYNDTVAAALVYRDYNPDFMGKQGDVVNVRVPAVFTANAFNRTAGIQVQNATEESFPVSLASLVDVSFDVTSEELLLDIDDFTGRLIQPAMEAINQKVDGDICSELVTAANQVAASGGDYPQQQTGGGVVSSADATEPLKALVAARAKLGRAKLPTTNRSALISPEGAEQVLNGTLIVQANTRGDTDGLIEASIGRKFGFDTYETQQLGPASAVGKVVQADGVAFHEQAVCLVTRALPIPLGKQDSNGDTVGAAVEQWKGMGLRVVYDYNVNTKQDVISIDFLYGIRAIRPQGVVQLNLGAS